nr:hypothetical protein [Tanacetum cinerariifolium]
GHEEPYAHLREFFSIADTYQVNNTTKNGFHKAFSRLKELLRTCPHHDIPKWELVKVFYDGLDYHNQQFVIATSGGTFFSQRMEEEWEFFKTLSKGSKTQDSMDQNNNHTYFANFVSNQHGTNFEISKLSKKVDILLRNLGKGIPNVSQVSHNACSMCGDSCHSVNNCQSSRVPLNEEVNGVYGNRLQNNPFYESYNPGWRNHPNFRWKDDDNRPNNTQQQNHSYKPSELVNSNQGANLKFESLSKSLVNLERQMGQLAEEMHKREAGKLPSYPDLNPKHKPCDPEHVNMDDEIVVEAIESPKVREGGVSSTTTPYPEALEKSTSARLAKKGPHFEDMWETFKQVKINLPFIDAIKQIPAYAKFLKDLCTQKRKLKATLPKNIDLTEHVSAVLSSSLPPKFKDPGASLISVLVGNITIKKALLDLGASINILPTSLVDKYDLGTLCKTDTVIFLADRSTKIPKGILEDVIVKVDDFYYPVDFFVMSTESPYKDVQPNIILGRPFLATIDARINCQTGTMDIDFGNRKLRLNVFNSVNSPISNNCYNIDTIDKCI